MFKKVLIAEDQEMMNIALRQTMVKLGVVLDARDYVTRCDDALARIKIAIREKKPYELLITDLSFKTDSRAVEISSGAELIQTIKHLQPDIKVLVFSVHDQESIANALFNELGIDGYVTKGLQDSVDFNLAINAIAKGKIYRSANLKRSFENEVNYELKPVEKTILTFVSEGKTQKWIEGYLKKNKVKPSSSSIIDKKLSRLRGIFNTASTTQLICYLKDKGLI